MSLRSIVRGMAVLLFAASVSCAGSGPAPYRPSEEGPTPVPPPESAALVGRHWAEFIGRAVSRAGRLQESTFAGVNVVRSGADAGVVEDAGYFATETKVFSIKGRALVPLPVASVLVEGQHYAVATATLDGRVRLELDNIKTYGPAAPGLCSDPSMTHYVNVVVRGKWSWTVKQAVKVEGKLTLMPAEASLELKRELEKTFAAGTWVPASLASSKELCSRLAKSTALARPRARTGA